MEKLNFSIGILTWKDHDTLINTLESYRQNGLLQLTDDIILYAQEANENDVKISDMYGLTAIIESKHNVGIGRAFNDLFHYAKYDKVLILENDWILLEDKVVTHDVIKSSMEVLDDIVDFVRLRHVKTPGDPLYTRQFANREMDSPYHLLDAIHWHGEDLKYKFPDKIGQIKDFMFTDSEFGNHTNNPFMCTKEFYNTSIKPFSGEGIELEGKINEHWIKANHIVAHNTTGLFTHFRINR